MIYITIIDPSGFYFIYFIGVSLQDVLVGVFDTTYHSLWDYVKNMDYPICGRYSGTFGSGETATMKCSKDGNYVVVQILGDNQILTLCEVMVYGEGKYSIREVACMTCNLKDTS
jgi:hypothetical protein